MVKNILWVFLGLILMFFMFGVDWEGHDKAVNACTDKGVAFYKEAGIYPKFTTLPNKGRFTEDVVRERCGQNTKVFD